MSEIDQYRVFARIADEIDRIRIGRFTYEQTAPSAQWSILLPVLLQNQPVGVTIYVGGQEVEADVEVLATQVIITFSNPAAGFAVIN